MLPGQITLVADLFDVVFNQKLCQRFYSVRSAYPHSTDMVARTAMLAPPHRLLEPLQSVCSGGSVEMLYFTSGSKVRHPGRGAYCLMFLTSVINANRCTGSAFNALASVVLQTVPLVLADLGVFCSCAKHAKALRSGSCTSGFPKDMCISSFGHA